MVMRRVLLAMVLTASVTAVACDDSTSTGGDVTSPDVTTDSVTAGDVTPDGVGPDSATLPDGSGLLDTASDTTADGAPLPDATIDTTPTPDVVEDVVPLDAIHDADVDAPFSDATISDVPVIPDAVTDAPMPDATPDTAPDTAPDVVADTTPDTSPDVVVPPAAGYYSHVIAVELPEKAADYACDGNNDGKIDAADGDINGLLGTLAGFGVDANAELTKTVEKGSLVLLLKILGFDGTATTNAKLELLIGDDMEVQPDPTCGVGANLEASCDWVASDSSYDASGVPKVSVSGAKVGSGKLSAGPASIGFAVPITDGLVLDLDIQNGTIKGDMTGKFDITNGRICGSVPKQSIKDGLTAACAEPDPPSFCDFIGVLDFVLTCEPNCSVVIAFESAEALSVSPPLL